MQWSGKEIIGIDYGIAIRILMNGKMTMSLTICCKMELISINLESVTLQFFTVEMMSKLRMILVHNLVVSTDRCPLLCCNQSLIDLVVAFPEACLVIGGDVDSRLEHAVRNTHCWPYWTLVLQPHTPLLSMFVCFGPLFRRLIMKIWSATLMMTILISCANDDVLYTLR